MNYMQLTALNWLIIIIGVCLCFGGIVFKRIFEAILGFVWGFSLSYLVLVIMALVGTSGVKDMDDASSLIVLVIVGLIFAALTVYLERLLITIHSFAISFSIVFIVAAFAMQDSDVSVVLLIAIVIAAIISVVMWKYYVYAFIIETAVTGAIMINHVGLFGGTDPSGLFYRLMFGAGSADNSGAILITCMIAIAGIVVQSMILKSFENRVSGGSNISLNDVFGKTGSINQMFPATDISKGSLSSVRFYEKLLILAPVFLYLVFKILIQFQMDPPTIAIRNFLSSTWEIRNILQLIFEGMFIGGIVFFTVYYEAKVAGLYQLLYFIWVPLEMYYYSKYNYSTVFYSGTQFIIVELFKFVLIWLIVLLIDNAIKNEKLKLAVSVIAVIVLYSFVMEYISKGYVYVYFNRDIIIRWIAVAATVILMSYFWHKNLDGYCIKCGTKKLNGDCYCRKCGNQYEKTE